MFFVFPLNVEHETQSELYSKGCFLTKCCLGIHHHPWVCLQKRAKVNHFKDRTWQDLTTVGVTSEWSKAWPDLRPWWRGSLRWAWWRNAAVWWSCMTLHGGILGDDKGYNLNLTLPIHKCALKVPMGCNYPIFWVHTGLTHDQYASWNSGVLLILLSEKLVASSRADNQENF